jgi:hypothetical protein
MRGRQEGEWPTTSSPTKPPKAVLYYGRYIGGVVQHSLVESFAEEWQLGVVLNELLKEAEDFQFTHPNEGYIATYSTRNAEGDKLSWLIRTACVDMRKAIELGQKHGVQIPWEIDNLLRRLSGRPSISYLTWAGGESPKAEPRAPREPRPAGAPRASRDGKITLDSLCEGTSWDPSKVRAALRKRGIEKPVGGWMFEDGDERIGIIKGIVGK